MKANCADCQAVFESVPTNCVYFMATRCDACREREIDRIMKVNGWA